MTEMNQRTRDPERIDRILAMVSNYWHAHPDQRLGQVVLNLTRDCGVTISTNELWMLEDDRFEREYAKAVARRRPSRSKGDC